MKKILLFILALFNFQLAFASDFAKLRLKIAGATNDNRYFLCVGSAGCVSIKIGDQGTIYPIEAGNIDYIYITSLATLQVYPQSLPNSCKVPIQTNQTVTITGKIAKAANDAVYIEHLTCRVS